MCLSKGLTGGYLPLSAVLAGEEIYAAFYDEYEKLRAFLHSHSYTGNPLACAVARATLRIFATEPVIERNRVLAARLAAAAAPLADHPHVAEVRQHGMILAAELVRSKATRESYDFRERRGLRVYRHALDRGLLLRPVGNVVYFMPPYVISAGRNRFYGAGRRGGHRGRDMRLTRVHVAEALAGRSELLLPDGPSAHLLRVLRLQVGSPLRVFDGRGGEYDAQISALDRRGARLRLGAHHPVDA